MSFVHLHNHSHYSLLDGLTKIDEMVNYAKEQGSPAIALTDHGNMYGAIEFYQKAKKAGLKPIIGVEAYLAPGSRFDKNTREDGRSYHLLLLAKNLTGYNNLIKLVSAAHIEGFYYKPRIDWELLTAHHDGLIAFTACLAGEIPRLIVADRLPEAEKRILEYNDLFGQDNFYLELMDHPELGEDQLKVRAQLIEFSRKLGIPLVATNDVHYLNKEDAEAQDILLCLQNKKKLEDTDRLKMLGWGDYSLRPNSEMIAAFRDVPEAVANTLKIADKCDLEIELGNIQLPYFEVPDGHDGDSYLRAWCERGIAKRYPQIGAVESEKIKERLDYELAVIAKMGWPSYFLIVADFINWAKDNKIVVGPGRGSAAGSLVCYLTGITNLDPLKYDLLFERFLNPDRISMPDIDMDFADIRRGEVINYVEEKYGQDHVAQIITFGTMAARAAVRDVGRVLNQPYDYCDRISKSIPMFMKLKEALKVVPELREMYNNEPEAKRILDYAKRLEGVARHASTHACGVLITKNPLTEYVPIQYASSADRSIISQYSLHPIEDLGLLKMDFLGLKNLTIIESALKIIKNTRDLEINIDDIPLDDEATYSLFQAGETTGVFQFESSGMKRYLRELKPTVFEDIIAMVALYRPGPMEWIPDYIAGKHKVKKVSYLHPKLAPILEKTYGVAIYQEQVMQIARDLSGFTMGQADILRKAMGKKIASLLAEQKEKFIEGGVKNGVPKELAEKIFSFIEPFAGYGFNRSHAACYALIGYQTAYLKAHWPVEFMAALLTSDQGDTDRTAIEIEECRNMGLKIMAPDINESFATFTVVTGGTKENRAVGGNEKVNTIRFGLKAIKNVGEHIVEEIIREKKQAGPYRDIVDLLERVTDKDLNKKSLESLIKSGALDSFGERGELLGNMERLLNFNKELAKLKDSKQGNLFSNLPTAAAPRFSLHPYPAAVQSEKLNWEKELLGLYISEHPINVFRPYLVDYALPLASLKSHRDDDRVITAGIISTIKKIITRKGESMLFVKVEDASNSVELLIFPRLLKEAPELWRERAAIIIDGKVSEKDKEIKVLVNRAAALDPNSPQKSVDDFKKLIMAAGPIKTFRYRQGNGAGNEIKKANEIKKVNEATVVKKTIVPPVAPPLKPRPSSLPPLRLIFVKNPGPEDLEELRRLFSLYPGESEVYFKITEAGKAQVIKTAFRVADSEELRAELKNKFLEAIKIAE
ncbi:TPA: DNA polymerase III subunit alpha [Candidatus Falkowbacteria bacterium]|nr:MAG: polymerase III alpha subunit protein [Candidatus Falkowbacteria bacterium GW2011_GWF2_43_32]HBA36903.1 DNA polymerase III subunit alpha [Candidatus Falkowbacteria bacterium]